MAALTEPAVLHDCCQNHDSLRKYVGAVRESRDGNTLTFLKSSGVPTLRDNCFVSCVLSPDKERTDQDLIAHIDSFLSISSDSQL